MQRGGGILLYGHRSATEWRSGCSPSATARDTPPWSGVSSGIIAALWRMRPRVGSICFASTAIGNYPIPLLAFNLREFTARPNYSIYPDLLGPTMAGRSRHLSKASSMNCTSARLRRKVLLLQQFVSSIDWQIWA